MNEHSEQQTISAAHALSERLRAEGAALGHHLEGLEDVEPFGATGDNWVCVCGAYVAELVAGDRVLDTAWNGQVLRRCPLAPKDADAPPR